MAKKELYSFTIELERETQKEVQVEREVEVEKEVEGKATQK